MIDGKQGPVRQYLHNYGVIPGLLLHVYAGWHLSNVVLPKNETSYTRLSAPIRLAYDVSEFITWKPLEPYPETFGQFMYRRTVDSGLEAKAANTLSATERKTLDLQLAKAKKTAEELPSLVRSTPVLGSYLQHRPIDSSLEDRAKQPQMTDDEAKTFASQKAAANETLNSWYVKPIKDFGHPANLAYAGVAITLGELWKRWHCRHRVD